MPHAVKWIQRNLETRLPEYLGGFTIEVSYQQVWEINTNIIQIMD
jgi:hypothetical protein